MSAKMLQINFKLDLSRAAYEQAVAYLAEEFVKVPGCRWKIWLMNETTHEAGGIYQFEDGATLQAYLASPLITQAAQNPAFSDFSVKQFDVLESLTKISRGPIE